MPATPVYGITFPCEGAPVTLADFADNASTTETAMTAVELDSVAATHLATASLFATANPAFGVEATFVYNVIPALNASNGITVNTATGAITVITGGIYQAGSQMRLADSTLTMTSSRVAVAVNGVNIVARKYRGFNPPDPTVLSGAFCADIYAAAGDIITFRFLWTGTGALLSGAQATVTLDLLATP
jgi:hypothetical protein